MRPTTTLLIATAALASAKDIVNANNWGQHDQRRPHARDFSVAKVDSHHQDLDVTQRSTGALDIEVTEADGDKEKLTSRPLVTTEGEEMKSPGAVQTGAEEIEVKGTGEDEGETKEIGPRESNAEEIEVEVTKEGEDEGKGDEEGDKKKIEPRCSGITCPESWKCVIL